MFSQTHEYALRAVVCLGQNHPTPMTTQQLATLGKVPKGYMSKVLQTLAKAEVIRAIRGIYGGYVLNTPPEDLSILRVIQAIEPFKRIRSCPLRLASHGTRLCPLHKRVDEAMETVEKVFAETTLAQLLAEPSDSVPLCEGLAGKVQQPTVHGH